MINFALNHLDDTQNPQNDKHYKTKNDQVIFRKGFIVFLDQFNHI